MPRKERNYQSHNVIYRPSEDVTDDIPKNFIGSYLDPSLWAFSTLPPGDYEDLVSVHTVKQGKFQSRETVRQRMWLHDILDDENIPYQVVIKSYWVSRRKYSEDQVIYVREEHRKKARKLIKAFKNPENTVHENPDDENSPEIFVDGILQKKCTACGKEIDFDYQKCPLCKVKLS